MPGSMAGSVDHAQVPVADARTEGDEVAIGQGPIHWRVLGREGMSRNRHPVAFTDRRRSRHVIHMMMSEEDHRESAPLARQRIIIL